MSKGLDMLRDYIEHDALCMRRRKCCEIEDALMQEMDALKAENAKLREKYYEYESKMDGLVRRLTGGLISKSAATPNDALYSATMEQMTDELIGENFKLESENKKLRELVHTIWLAGDFRAFLGVGELEGRMCKLGIEVDDE